MGSAGAHAGDHPSHDLTNGQLFQQTCDNTGTAAAVLACHRSTRRSYHRSEHSIQMGGPLNVSHHSMGTFRHNHPLHCSRMYTRLQR